MISNINVAGDLPIVVCGVSLMMNNNLCSNVPSVCFLRLCLNVCTARSTIPFNDGWYDVTSMLVDKMNEILLLKLWTIV